MDKEAKLDLIATKLAVRMSFVSTLFSGMERSFDESIPTAAVKGMHVKFNPDFFMAMEDEEAVFVAAHEAMHTGLLHSYRLGDRDPALWNEAGDAVINRELVEFGLKMPVWSQAMLDLFPDSGQKLGARMGVLYPWVTEQMTTEDVYKRLQQEQEEEKKKPKSGKGDKGDKKGGWGNQGDLEEAEGDDGDGAAEAEARVLVTQAARTAFASGDKSEMIKKILGVVKQGNADWKEETRSMLNDHSRNDYSTRRFSRRFIGDGLYVPSLYSEELGVLGVGVDTSGSMQQPQLDRIGRELQTIIEDCAPLRTIVVYCDSRINRVDVYERGEEIKLTLCGGGGTDMRKITNYFEEVEERMAGVIVFTDLETPFPQVEPAYPLIWGAVGARSGVVAPVGQTVEVRV